MVKFQALGRGAQGPHCKHSTCLFLGDGSCAEADREDDDGGEPAEEEREVEVVEVLEHCRPAVLLPAGGGWVAELQDHA